VGLSVEVAVFEWGFEAGGVRDFDGVRGFWLVRLSASSIWRRCRFLPWECSSVTRSTQAMGASSIIVDAWMIPLFELAASQ